MGQKVHPIGYRLGFTKTWNAKWFAEAKTYRVLLKEDIAIRSTIRGRLRDAAIARIDIERSTNQVTVTIQTAKPGVVIGKGGAKVEELRQALGKAAEMSRREWEREGRVPLHTLRADIEFGRAIAKTTYGTIGVKAWIYRGDIEPAPRQVSQNAPAAASRPAAMGAPSGPSAPAPVAPVAPTTPAPAGPVGAA